MTPKTTFKLQLANVYKAYAKYLDDVIKEDESIAVLKFKFSLVLTMIEDLYHGSVEQQQNALTLLSELNIDAVEKSLRLPTTMLKKLVYSPESYASNIEYVDEEVHDLLI